MNKAYFNPSINCSRQEGAVLVVALIILVVLTMLGISGIESTKLETRMAANTRDYNLAFQNAESGLAQIFNSCTGAVRNGEIERVLEQTSSAGFGTAGCFNHPSSTLQQAMWNLSSFTSCRGTNGSVKEVAFLAQSRGYSNLQNIPTNDSGTMRVTLTAGMKFLGADTSDLKECAITGCPDLPGDKICTQIDLNCVEGLRDAAQVTDDPKVCLDEYIDTACDIFVSTQNESSKKESKSSTVPEGEEPSPSESPTIPEGEEPSPEEENKSENPITTEDCKTQLRNWIKAIIPSLPESCKNKPLDENTCNTDIRAACEAENTEPQRIDECVQALEKQQQNQENEAN